MPFFNRNFIMSVPESKRKRVEGKAVSNKKLSGGVGCAEDEKIAASNNTTTSTTTSHNNPLLLPQQLSAKSLQSEKTRLLCHEEDITKVIWERVKSDDLSLITFLSNMFPESAYPKDVIRKCLVCKKDIKTGNNERCILNHKISSRDWNYRGKIMYKRKLQYGCNAYDGNCRNCKKQFFGEGNDEGVEREDYPKFVPGCCYSGDRHTTDKAKAAKIWDQIYKEGKKKCEYSDSSEESRGYSGEENSEDDDEDSDDEDQSENDN